MKNLKLDRYYPVIVFVAVGIVSLITHVVFRETICIFTKILGIPCPACGMTRAYISLLHWDIKAAFWYHPLMPIPILICILAFFGKLNNRMIFIFIGLFIFVWISRMILLFPSQIEPMVFDANAIVPMMFSKLIQLF